jgi:hypothetical protein
LADIKHPEIKGRRIHSLNSAGSTVFIQDDGLGRSIILKGLKECSDGEKLAKDTRYPNQVTGESADKMTLSRDGPGKLRGSKRIFITGIFLLTDAVKIPDVTGNGVLHMLQITAGNVSNLCGDDLSWLRPATAGSVIFVRFYCYSVILNYLEL